MARMGRVSAGDLKKLQQELNKIEQKDVESFISACAKELAARLLAKVIKRTPVGDYSKEITVVAKKDSKHHKAGDTYAKRVNPSGKMGGTLRRGWTSATHEEAASGKGRGDARAYADSLQINHVGNLLTIDIVNPVEYASYVEYEQQHFQRYGFGWRCFCYGRGCSGSNRHSRRGGA